MGRCIKCGREIESGKLCKQCKITKMVVVDDKIKNTGKAAGGIFGAIASILFIIGKIFGDRGTASGQKKKQY